MLLTPTITSRLIAIFYAPQAVSPPSSEKEQPTNLTQPHKPQISQTQPVRDDKIFDDWLDEKERKATLPLMYIGWDVTRHILEYSTTYDLCAHIRGVNQDFRKLVSVSSGWFVRRLLASRGVLDCAQVIRVMMHTYVYGKEINDRALGIKSWEQTIREDLFFHCATRLWAYEDSITRLGDFPTMHEVVMTWCHGLEFVSKQLFGLFLTRFGMDEKNLSARERRELRKMYLEYKEKLGKDGLRMVDVAVHRQEVGSCGFDWRWLDDIGNDESSEREEAMYPICYVHPVLNKKVAQRRIDPLVMMGLLRNREMSRRFCHLFVDFDDTTSMSDDDFKDLHECLRLYVSEMIVLGQEEDVAFIEALFTKMQNTRSHITLSPRYLTKRIIEVYEQSYIRQRVLVMNSYHGFDMDWDLDEKRVQQKLLFARALLPMCLSRIGEDAVRADPKLTKLLGALEPKGDENDALKKELKQIFWSCF